MAVVGELLSDIVSDYGNVSSLSGSALIDKCCVIRQSVKKIVVSHLSDVEIVRKELNKTKGKTSQTEIYLNFIHHLVSQFPHPVFAPTPAQFLFLPEELREKATREYKGFTDWFWNSMLSLLCETALEDIHAIAVKLLGTWLELLKTKNINVLGNILSDTVNLLTELNQIHERSVSSDRGDFDEYPVSLESFVAIDKVERSHLVIRNFVSLQCLIENCCKLLKVFVSDVYHFASKKVESLWCVLLFQLDYGSIKLKGTSFDMLLDLLKLQGIPSSMLYNHMMYCAVACMEMTTEAIKGTNDSLRQDSDWLPFLISLSKFLKELFAVSVADSEKDGEQNNFQMCFIKRHDVKEEHLSAVCNYLVTELVGLERFEGISQEELQYVVALIQIVKYFGQSLNAVLCTDMRAASDYNNICMMQKLNVWILNSGYLTLEEVSHCGIDVLSYCVIIEMKFFTSNALCDLSETEKQQSIINMLEKHSQKLLSDVVLISKQQEVGDNDLKLALWYIEDFNLAIQVMTHVIQKLKVIDFANIAADQVEKALLIFLHHDKGVEFFQGLFEIMRKTTQRKDFQHFTLCCIKLVQNFSLLLHCASSIEISEIKAVCDRFCEATALLFSAVSSLPWAPHTKWEDFESDLKESGIKDSYLIPISQALENSKLQYSDDVTIKPLSNRILHECLKAISILHSPKYARLRSSILFKWTSDKTSDIKNIALTFLPFFIVKALPGTAAFKGIFFHVRSLMKNVEADFNHSNLLSMTFMLHKIAELMICRCEIILCKTLDTLCEECKYFQPCIFGFRLDFKSTRSDNQLRKQRDDVLLLVGSVVTEVSNVMTGHWISFSPFAKVSADDNQTTKDCFNVLQTQVIEFFGNYLTLIKDRPMSDSTRLIIKNWLQTLQYYNDTMLYERIVGSLNLKNGSEQVRENMKLMDDLVILARQNKDLSLRLLLNKVFGVSLKYSLEEPQEQVGCSILFNWALTQLFASLSSTSLLIQSSAYLELSSVLLTDALHKYRSTISTCLAKTLIGEHNCVGNRPAIEIVEDIGLLYCLNSNEYLERNMQLIAPIVITSKRKESLLKLFSEIMNVNLTDLLMPNFKHIFCYAVITNYNPEQLFAYLEEKTRIKKDSLLLLNYGGLLHHLVAYINVNVNQIHKAIDVISKVKDSTTIKKLSKSKALSNLSDLLHPHFLGILTFFTCQLRSAAVIPEEKKNIIESLICLLKLMKSKDVTIVRVKIINTLCLAQGLFELSSWYEACCDAWSAFVRRVEGVYLGPLLSQISVTLLPLLEVLPSQVASVFTYLVIERYADTSIHLHELYFLPNHQRLISVKQKIEDVLKSQDASDLKTQLTQAMCLLSHESSEVRIQALTRLRHTLKVKQKDVQLHHSISGQNATDEVMSKLVANLLIGCRNANKSVKLLSGQCLGLIGAIDPDRLVLDMHGVASSTEFFMVDNPNFSFHLISELVKSFLAAEPTHQDISAFAIQELLKIYECREGPKETLGRKLWRKFPPNVKDVLHPHHTSRYVLKKTDASLANLKQPVMLRKANMTFQDWTGIFCSLLMQMVYENNERSTASRVFHACSAVARNDINIALFLLPHSTLQALLQTNHVDFIVQEILMILEQTEQLKDRANVEFESESLNNRSVSEQPILQDNSSNFINTPHARGSNLLQLSAQAIFSVLDHVTRWLRQAETDGGDLKLRTPSHNRNLKSSPDIEKVKSFLGRIPQLLLAQASFRCRAYKRALLHYEAHIRGNWNARSQKEQFHIDEQAITFLQRIFGEMDEPDGVAGISAVQSAKPTLSIQIKQFESTGKLQDACACYAHVIERNPNELQVVKDYVKCLMNLGQLSTATCLMDGTISKNASWKVDLNSYRIEAAWRLGRWDSLEEYMNLEVNRDAFSNSHDWNTRLGELLLLVKEERFDEFQNIINDVYHDQTGLLSAATMESGSYQRGYKSILRLHMLTELESFTEDMKSCSKESDISQMASQCFTMWQERLQPMQNSFKSREPIICLQRALLDLMDSFISKKKNSRVGDALVKNVVGKLWLQTAKQARKAGYLQTAYNALINAQDIEMPEFCIEKSKWLWNKGESHKALLTLQKGVADYYPATVVTDMKHTEKFSKAKAMLLVARLMEESSSFESNMVLKQFKEVAEFMPEMEDSYFYLAKYYDKLMGAFARDPKSQSKGSYLYYMIRNYGTSLRYGTTHIYESLTKLLTSWLDFESNVVRSDKPNKKTGVVETKGVSDGTSQSHEADMQKRAKSESLKKMNEEHGEKLNHLVAELREHLPAYVFLTAFSQLVSRICHPNSQTFSELKLIVVKVIRTYPQQALWNLMAVSKSSYSQRADRCKEIFCLAELKNKKLSKILSDATKLTDRLLELCNKQAPSGHPLSMCTHFKPLKRMVEDKSFSKILPPLQRYMTVTLPQGDNLLLSQEQATSIGAVADVKHNPFPEQAIHIVGFEDAIEVLPSLQRPKKVSIRASDGKSYLFLCKPKDDLRKDARMMEFNTIVNKCLKIDSETRRRQLNIRTYAVVPLNEECGLIEWVPNTRGLRHILYHIYKDIGASCNNRELLAYRVPKTEPLQAVVPLNEECGLIEWVPNTQGFRNILLKIYRSRDMHTSAKMVQSLNLPKNAPLEKKLSVFKNKLLPKHPPVFADWFLTAFPDPTSWYTARLAYARSTAVMSMVGYILGLGDRHGENILFDSTTGETVHVDFNCLFNKGLSLEVPEIVPFRLTHNMTDAMGPMKYEGFFRCACEAVMRLLRQQREPLLSVLKTFIYDPLVEWKWIRQIRGGQMGEGQANESGEMLKEMALSHVNDIDKRLRGIATKNKCLPLSVEGHVDYLIREATDESKLCQMYIGWAPYL